MARAGGRGLRPLLGFAHGSQDYGGLKTSFFFDIVRHVYGVIILLLIHLHTVSDEITHSISITWTFDHLSVIRVFTVLSSFVFLNIQVINCLYSPYSKARMCTSGLTAPQNSSKPLFPSPAPLQSLVTFILLLIFMKWSFNFIKFYTWVIEVILCPPFCAWDIPFNVIS